MVCEEYKITIEFPINSLFGVESNKYEAKMLVKETLISLKDVLKELNKEIIRSKIFESYIEGNSGFYIFVNDNLVKDINISLKELIKTRCSINIKILPIFEGG
jgi:hypothetical protein